MLAETVYGKKLIVLDIPTGYYTKYEYRIPELNEYYLDIWGNVSLCNRTLKISENTNNDLSKRLILYEEERLKKYRVSVEYILTKEELNELLDTLKKDFSESGIFVEEL